ncbi:MAG: class I SAM-dependent methyltransferase [Phycisphaerales bacterium]|nr:class I SAM-dependent methyltransferase [Phycisphaerales bacterium]MCB9858572.1 class I SAM-dependent methyltransferase [Phycisphaerales bacterium]
MNTPSCRETWLDRSCRRAILRLLSGIREGRVTLIDGQSQHVFGNAGCGSPISVTVTVHSPALYRRAALGGHIAMARSYADGLWSCDNLTGLIRIFVRQLEVMDATDRGWARIVKPLHGAFHWLRRNSRVGSRRNIAAHYDLGNDLFELILDDTMTYSAGIFETSESTMREASIAKIDRLCRKLRLGPGDRLLEIGTGWGSFAVHAASRYGCHVTTATVSREQYDVATRRIEAAGLSDQVDVLLCDYRDLSGEYDKLVCVEMIEAVGHQYYDTFFRKCSNLLAPHGLMALQAITIPDHRYELARRTVDFIKRDIFPGSCIPSIERMCRSVARGTDLKLTHLEDITPHYAETLARWRRRMHGNIDAIRALGYTDRFLRLWEFYLCYCEGGFAERYTGCVQLLFAKPRNRSNPVLPVLTHEVGGLDS